MTANVHDNDLQELRDQLALGCRVLAARELSPGFLGHISLRLDEERILVRCRGPHESGLAHTTARDVRVVTLDGEPGLPGELDGWTVPHELPLHVQILRRRPDVRCVVHAHPRRTVAADLAGLVLEPLVGAYDIPGSALVAGGVPVYPRSVLVCSDALGDKVAEHLGDHAAALLRGHGVVVTGDSVPEAVLRAVSIDEIAHLSLLVAAAGGRPRPIDEADRAELPDLGGSINLDVAWRHELSRLPATPRT
ncbi:class II aldolase/adducin family protein [Actinomadura sp. BRA 177]|uniref:class II aldolase/adducin family protein n=1 Tax=Actinomadura sp. BRA 177 TaxID=2745202 RepID=UPI0015955C35|nr:class II aldolase/adducin family protein [Actinomadura sp. BRA 177]NVI88343.1 class II aldolase/adducin family protein [Actinomadura sp. BRA 177]